MNRLDLKVLVVFLSSIFFCITPQASGADDFNKATEALTKIYKFDKLANGYFFGSFAANDSSTKYKKNMKKSGSSGFNIRALKSLQYKIDQNQILDLKKSGLSYVFRVQF